MYIILPVGVEHRANRYPIVTFTFMGISTVIFLVLFGLELRQGEAVTEWEISTLWLTPSVSHFWTYVTSLFVHADFFHLLGNMMFLFLFGACVEDKIGRARFLGFYLMGGIVSSLIQILATPFGFNSEIPIGGASGAISACIGGFLPYFWNTKIEFKYFWFFVVRFGSGEFFVPAWLVISFWFGKDLWGALDAASETQDRGGVAFAAHAGGTLFGLAVIGVERALSKRREAREAKLEIAEATERSLQPTLMVLADGQQYGPFNRAQIREMVDLGSLPVDAFFWCDGMPDWQPISALLERKT